MKNKIKIVLTLCAISSFILSSCSKGEITFCSCADDNPSIDSGDVPIYLPPEEEGKVLIHSEVQRMYLAYPVEKVNLFARGTDEISRPLRPEFTWDPIETEEDEEVTYTIFLSDTPNFSNAYVYTSTEPSIKFLNLKIGTNYRYRVMANQKIIAEDSFTTSSEIIRNVYVSGVANARDLGGYPVEGGITKQGLIYRTGRLNQNSTDEVENRITSTGITTMLENLQVKTEIDLRTVSDNEVGGLTEGVGVLGETVNYYQCPMEYNLKSLDMDTTLNNSSLKKVFSIFGNKENYPVFFHCSIGTDRTGYIAWLINSCLGLEEEYLWRDYLFSNFASISGARTKSYVENGYLPVIKEFEGNTLQEKTINYLLDKGVSQKDIVTLQEIMLDKD